MDNKPLRVACYARYSTSMQREESISAQLRAIVYPCSVLHFDLAAADVANSYVFFHFNYLQIYI